MNAKPLVSKTLLISGIVLAVVMLTALLVIARNLMPLIFGSVLIAVVLNRFARNFGSILPASVPRRVRVGAIMGVLVVLAFVGVYGFANSASEQIVRLADRVESSVDKVWQAAKDQPLIERYLGEDANVGAMVPSSTKSLGLAKNFFATTFGGLADCLILVVLAAYFALSPEKYRAGAIRLVPIDWREHLSSLLKDSGETLWRWMLGRLLAMAIVGILFGIGLAIIGIPMSVELGIFAALVTFIPNIGGLLAVVPALLLATQQGSTAALSVLALYLAIQFVESYLITPMVQEHQVSLPPAAVILAQILAGLLFGFWGVVFATPMVAVSLLWVKDLYVEGWLEKEES